MNYGNDPAEVEMKPEPGSVEITVKRRFLPILVLLLLGAVAPARAEIMPLSEVHRGMKGYGLTVFEGKAVERFDVEIIGVLRNIGPRQNLILARVDNEIVKHSGIIAGMSGSPIFIDGKVVGALAYSWQFAKEPIAGVTPIEEMLQISSLKGSATSGRQMSSGEFVASIKEIGSDSLLDRITGLTRHGAAGDTAALPIAVPLSFGNFSSGTIERYGKYLESGGFLPVPSGTTAAGTASADGKVDRTPFRPGDAIAGVLVDGDFSVAATGTVTYVDGDDVYAFGHPFLDLGRISFPMARSEVVAIMPNLARSFKFANSGEVVGALEQDRAVGIMGRSGAKASMIPIEVTVDGANGPEIYHLRVVRHPQLSPLMIAMAADNVVASSQRAAGERTIVLDSEIDIEGFPPIRLQDGWAGAQARQAIPNYLALISGYLLSNEFRDARIDGIKLHLRHDDQLRIAKITEASIDTTPDGKVHPGETVRLRANLKPYRGDPFQETFEIRIPDNQQPGPLYLFVGSGSAIGQLDFALVPPAPNSLEQVVQVVNRLRSSTNLTVGMYSKSSGAVTSGVYLPDLPPSINAVVGSDSTNSLQAPVAYFAPEHLVRPLEYVVEGTARIDLNVSPRL